MTEELAGREALAREALAGHEFTSHPHLPFLWLKLPAPWLSGTFKAAAGQADVLIDDEDEFKADRLERSFHRVRLAFSSLDRPALAEGSDVCAASSIRAPRATTAKCDDRPE